MAKTYRSFDELLETCSDVFKFGLRRYTHPGEESLLDMDLGASFNQSFVGSFKALLDHTHPPPMVME